MTFSTLIDEIIQKEKEKQQEQERRRLEKLELEKAKLLEARKQEHDREIRDLELFTAFGTNQEIKEKATKIYLTALDATHDKRFNEAIELSREIDSLIGDTTKQAKFWTASLRVVSFYHLSELDLANAELDVFYSEGRPARRLKKKMNAYRDQLESRLSSSPNAAQTHNSDNNGFVEPVPIRRSAPRYPAKARRDEISTLVTVKFIIDSTGSTKSCSATTEADEIYNFERAACHTVLQWKYKPASLNGSPIDYDMELTLDFNLK